MRNGYRRHHQKLCLRIHWEIFRRLGRECVEKWYEHSPPSIVVNEQAKLTWDKTILIDKSLERHCHVIIIVLCKRIIMNGFWWKLLYLGIGTLWKWNCRKYMGNKIWQEKSEKHTRSSWCCSLCWHRTIKLNRPNIETNDHGIRICFLIDKSVHTNCNLSLKQLGETIKL